MEVLTMRFSHLSEMIFDHLDNHSLANCKVVSKAWSIYIGEKKFYGIRIIKETVKKFYTLSQPWFEVFKKANTENIIELKSCLDHFYELTKQKHHGVFKCNKEVTPLHVSAGAGNSLLYETIHKFAKNKQPKTEDGFEPVIYAINRSHEEMAVFIIKRMVDKNPESKYGFTVLHIAAKYGLVEVCELILKHIQDKNPKSSYGDTTPLHMAAIFGHVRICELIMKQIDKKDPRDNFGRTPFHLAALNGRLEVCELYIKTIRDKHPRTTCGSTPLHMAAYNGHVNICMLILQRVKSKNPRNDYGETPLAIARERTQFKVCWLLEKIWNCVI
jgi:ankyrin repeat protein